MEFLQRFESYVPKKLYDKNQPQLFDINITDDDYERYDNSDYGKILNYWKQNKYDYETLAYDTDIDEIIEDVEEKLGIILDTDDVMYILDLYEDDQKENIEAKDKAESQRIDRAKQFVLEYGRKNKLDTETYQRGNTYYFNDEPLTYLFKYLTEYDGAVNSDDVAYMLGIEPHEAEEIKHRFVAGI